MIISVQYVRKRVNQYETHSNAVWWPTTASISSVCLIHLNPLHFSWINPSLLKFPQLFLSFSKSIIYLDLEYSFIRACHVGLWPAAVQMNDSRLGTTPAVMHRCFITSHTVWLSTICCVVFNFYYWMLNLPSKLITVTVITHDRSRFPFDSQSCSSE